MLVIGLTGPSGSGKSEVAKLLAEKGIPHIDCDSVYHSLISSESDCTQEIAEFFGTEVLNADGSVNRKKLSHIVFCGEDHEEKLALLGRITHKYVLVECRNMINEFEHLGKTAVTVDAPTLIESSFDRECDIVLVVTAPKEIRLKRITERDGITREAALERISSQNPDSFYTDRADFIINNDMGLNELKAQLEDFIIKYTKEKRP
ncbi:MAG: dephospho-CoA kinase [Ruminococcaceae bacterium]|nr:dephospho-CoA kinase [Oscillospiraceae bacterium]